ncbi:MAG: hypothetical protein J0M07_29885, partial [Anaerolineae bacterium]|nr:hypothetical protein [Anaerolineae bacterium]
MTNNQNPRDTLNLESHFRWLRVRRRTASEWLAWGLWLLSLAILLEYTWSSFVEGETQATVLAGALFFGLLAAGVIVNFNHSTEPEISRIVACTEQGLPIVSLANIDPIVHS